MFIGTYTIVIVEEQTILKTNLLNFAVIINVNSQLILELHMYHSF